MLASPVSPNVSLGSRTHTSPSSSSHSTPSGTHASPRHPAYLPLSSHNNASSPSQQSTASSSIGPASQGSTSNYSKYTTASQIGRVNDVLADRVLHAPIPLSRPDEHHRHGEGQEREKGTALTRLIAFLDGEEDAAISPAPLAGPSHTPTAIQASPVASESRYAREYPQMQAQPSTPPLPARPRSPLPHHGAGNREQSNHTPRPSSSYSQSQSHLHPSYGHPSHHAPFQLHHQQSPRTRQPDSERRGDTKSRATAATAGYKRHGTPPSQSVLLSTQTQLERLKSEVSHLDELVNRLKAQHIAIDQEDPRGQRSKAYQTEEQAQTPHERHEEVHGIGHEDNERQEDLIRGEEAEQAAEHDKRRIKLEYENTIASQNDILRLVRHLDSLVWMRNSTCPAPPSPHHPHVNQNERHDSSTRLSGKGTRKDDIIFTRGNLEHLARRMTAWENIVRRKEEEERYNTYIP